MLIFYCQVSAAQRRRVVRAAAEAVVPGGSLLLVGHDSLNLHDGYGAPQDPAVLYTAADVVSDLSDCDLEITRAERMRRTRRRSLSATALGADRPRKL